MAESRCLKCGEALPEEPGARESNQLRRTCMWLGLVTFIVAALALAGLEWMDGIVNRRSPNLPRDRIEVILAQLRNEDISHPMKERVTELLADQNAVIRSLWTMVIGAVAMTRLVAGILLVTGVVAGYLGTRGFRSIPGPAPKSPRPRVEAGGRPPEGERGWTRLLRFLWTGSATANPGALQRARILMRLGFVMLFLSAACGVLALYARMEAGRMMTSSQADELDLGRFHRRLDQEPISAASKESIYGVVAGLSEEVQNYQEAVVDFLEGMLAATGAMTAFGAVVAFQARRIARDLSGGTEPDPKPPL